ncbi:hypothetical protein GE061_007575 [Apolygus lucorum]|uniref:Fluoride ion transporter CrcB n=1 Tax=Apolygus lucorum TaxID=248454 RepID=A0A8S9WTN0_APOLU|nr:hypothetical protein GE061_007575 [Apolygus lucorum]
MGLFVKAFSILELPKTHNVYLGLTTGYCGTFSSFSSAALELFNVAAGTFTANALGSLVLAASTLLTLGTKPNNVPDEMIISDQLLCSILSAIGLGFCGALTTMSTYQSNQITVSQASKRKYFGPFTRRHFEIEITDINQNSSLQSILQSLIFVEFKLCFVCVRMEPIKAPVWDDPVPKEPYKLKDLPRTTANDSIPNPCSTGKSSFDSGDAPPPEWTRRGRRNAVWEITLDPALMSETVCCVEQPPDLDTVCSWVLRYDGILRSI